MMYVEANNARFWVEQAGEGQPVVFLHFGLGGWRVFEPELRALEEGNASTLRPRTLHQLATFYRISAQALLAENYVGLSARSGSFPALPRRLPRPA